MKTMKHLSKRGLALILALMMCFTMLPMQAFAAGGTDSLHPANVESKDKSVEISKTAERKTADTWEVTMSVNVNNNEIKPMPMDLVLLIDTSGSMGDKMSDTNECGLEEHNHKNCEVSCQKWSPLHRHNDSCYACGKVAHSHSNSCKSRMAAAKARAKELVGKLKESGLDVNIAVVSYASQGSAKLGLTSLATGKDSIDSAINDLSDDGATNMYGGLDVANQQFTNTGNKKVIVMLADGQWGYYSPGDKPEYEPTNAASIKEGGVEIYTIGFSDGASAAAETLRDVVATDASHYYSAADSTELANAFTAISTRVTAMVDDNMGDHVAISGPVKVVGDGDTEANVSEDGNGMTWNPANNAAVKGNVTFTYTVKADPEKIGTDGKVNLNGDAYLRYKVGETTAEPLKFPIPTDTVTVGSLTEKWFVDGTEVEGATTTQKKIYWEQDESSKTFTVAANAPEAVSGTFPTGSTLDGESWTESTTVGNDGGTHVLVHYYSTEEPKATFTVTYDLNGGTSTEQLVYTDLVEDTVTPTIANPTREGYTFTGWSPAVAGTVTGDATYTAQWKHNDLTGPLDPGTDPETPVIPDTPDHVYRVVDYTRPQCQVEGTVKLHCDTHDVDVTLKVRALDHVWPKTFTDNDDPHEVTFQANETVNMGTTHTHICELNNEHTETAEHNYPAEWEIVTPATQESDGLQQKVCEGCGHTVQQVLARETNQNVPFTVEWIANIGGVETTVNTSETIYGVEGAKKSVTEEQKAETISYDGFTYSYDTEDERNETAGTATLVFGATNVLKIYVKRNNTTLSVEKTADKTSAKVGDEITYTIKVTNNGEHEAVGVVVKEQPSESLSIEKVMKGNEELTATSEGYVIGNIAAGATVELTVTATVVDAPAEGATIKNVAIASLKNGENAEDGTGTEPGTDPDPTNPGGGKGENENVTYQVTVTWKDGYTDTPIKTATINKGADYQSLYPAEPTREGFVFDGWNTPSTDTAGNITITAQWEQKATVIVPDPEKPDDPQPVDPGVIIIVDPNGGTWTPPTNVTWEEDENTYRHTAKEGETITIPVPTWPDHNFLEWNVVETTGADGKVNTITYTAKWNANIKPVVAAYFVEHYKEDANTHEYAIVSDDTETKFAEIGKVVTADAKTYPGYAVDWNYSETVKEGTVFFTRPTANEDAKFLTLKVYYSIDKVVDPNVKPTVDPENPPKSDGIPDKYQVTVKYESADTAKGTVSGTSGTITLEDGDKYVTEKNITIDLGKTAQPGYKFDNWTLTVTPFGQATGNTVDNVDANATSYTVTGGNTYTFTAYWDAKGKGEIEYKPDPEQPVEPDQPTPTPTPTPDPGTGNVTETVDPEVILVVDPKGGNWEKDSQYQWTEKEGIIDETVKYTLYHRTIDENDDIKIVDPTREGYVFMGWTRTEVTTDNTKTITLTAHWEEDTKKDPTVDPTDPQEPGDGIPDKYQVTVTFQAEGGSFNGKTEVSTVVTLYKEVDGKMVPATATDGGVGHLTTIPTATADTGFVANSGKWDTTPTAETDIIADTTYRITFTKSIPVTPPTGGGGGGTDPTPAPRYTVNWEDGDGNIIKTTTITGTDVPASLYPADPEKENVPFLGWGEPDIVGNVITIIAEWDEEIDEGDVPLVVAPGLDSTDHFAYIIGYGDGTVRPTRNITRAEVATIFYRLMTDDYRGTFWCQTNDFTDVNSGDWFNNAVSTSAEAELVKGYADGTFKGKNNITRAEFATIAARFLSDDPTGENPFTDIDSHWAKNDILKAYEAGWINGYADGTFKPNALITRAEAMTIVNRMLNRVPHAEDLLPDEMTTYPDNQPGAWYYAAVQEATNSHDYEMGERDGETVETWTNMKPNRDWAALEKEWSDAYSGSDGNDVM